MSTSIAGEAPVIEGVDSFQLVWPIEADDLSDLRWYLEDYLRAPYGVYGERGPAVADALDGWGRAVFGALFATGWARDAYVRLPAGAEIVCRSSSAALLARPWELLWDPRRPRPLAVDHAIVRSVPSTELDGELTAAGERLRVLMVISRPRAEADVGYRMIARPLLDRLDAVRGRVELVVLRPPTLEALIDALSAGVATGDPFQIVHFDGHGALREAEGLLVFEGPGGGSDLVTASAIAQALSAGQVPLVVLNACQSGAVGKRLEATVATRLLDEGVPSVVAMAYNVYAVAAAAFMAEFYERIFAGDRVADAVTAGRRRLYEHNERPSPKGMMPLADWVVPVLYVRREVRFPYLRRERPGASPADESRHAGPPDPQGKFVGRDALFYALELATRADRVVVLHGPAGTGKTELAKAFGHWWRDTAAVEDPEWVVVRSFLPGVASFGLDGVITDIGLRVFGTDFARRAPEERRAAVEQLLDERRLLLIWDNFESVHTMPDRTAATAPLDEPEREGLRAFVQRVAAGSSSLIITSRTEEAWLGPVRRIEVGGLTPDEAIEYAELLLTDLAAAAQRRAKRSYAELMEWLGGHPLSMRVALPQLETTEPDVLLDRLRGAHDAAAAGGNGGLTSLAASLAYSLDHLDRQDRNLLVAVCLFQGVADVDILAALPSGDTVPERFAAPERQTWVDALDAAEAVGLLTARGGGMYGVHPALPSYLASRWRADAGDRYEEERAGTIRGLVTAHAGFAEELSSQMRGGDVRRSLAFMDHQRRTFGHLLGFAFDNRLWADAESLASALLAYFDLRGLDEEAAAWVNRGLRALGGIPQNLDGPAGELWLQLATERAERDMNRHDLDRAVHEYDELLRKLEDPASERQERHLAAALRGLGAVEHERGRLDDAERLHTRAIGLYEKLGDRSALAGGYHELGWVAQRRGRYDDAERWYRESLQINQDLGRQIDTANNFHHLGWLAQSRGDLAEAEDWFIRSVAITSRVGDRPKLARTYHSLGMVAYDRGLLDQAEDWYRRSLEIKEQLADRPRLATTYQQLGLLARARGNPEDAEAWLAKALKIREGLRDLPGMASTYDKLGEVARSSGRLDAAEERFAQALAIDEELRDRRATAGMYDKLGLLARDRGRLDDARAWLSKALAIEEERGNESGIGVVSQHLGQVARAQARPDEAEAWFRRSLDVHEQLGDRSAVALILSQLAPLAQEAGRLDEAAALVERCLALSEELDDRARMALACHQAGVLAYERDHIEEAEAFLKRSLDLYSELPDRPGVGDIYALLGTVAHVRGRTDEAEAWYTKHLRLSQDLGDRREVVTGYWRLAALASNDGRYAEAMESMVRCLALVETNSDELSNFDPTLFVELTSVLGIDALEAYWREVTGSRLPTAIRTLLPR